MSLGYLKGRLGEIKLAYRLLEYILHTKFYHCWYYHHQYLPSWCIIPTRGAEHHSAWYASVAPIHTASIVIVLFIIVVIILIVILSSSSSSPPSSSSPSSSYAHTWWWSAPRTRHHKERPRRGEPSHPHVPSSSTRLQSELMGNRRRHTSWSCLIIGVYQTRRNIRRRTTNT